MTTETLLECPLFQDSQTGALSAAVLRRALGFGTSSSELSYEEGTPIFTMYATCDNTSSTNAQPFYVKSTMTGTGGYGGRSQFHTYTNVSLQTNVMALKAFMEFGDSGRVAGLAAAFCAEIQTPDAAVGAGGVYALELEYVAGGDSTAVMDQSAGFIYMGNSGDADGDFDDHANLFTINGLTAGSTHLLSANSQTFRVAVGGTTRYLVMSQAENGLALGNSGTAQSYTAGTPPLNFYFTSSNQTSTNSEPFYLKSTMTGSGGYGGRSRFHAYTNVALTTNFMALKAHTEFGDSGSVSGLATGLCAEMVVPNATAGGGGYACLELEYVAGGTDTVANGYFIYMQQSGDTDGDFDDNGYLFKLDGMTVGTGHVFQENTAGDATHALRIQIGGTPYYIMLTSAGA